MGANHARVLSDTPGVELVAVADANPAAVNKSVAGRPIPGFPDAASLLRETRPDMVSIVVPTQLHEEVASRPSPRARNVLVEKPMPPTSMLPPDSVGPRKPPASCSPSVHRAL